AATAPTAAINASDDQTAVLDQSALEELPVASPGAIPAAAAPPAATPEVQEVDLSDEWASLLANDAATADTTAVPPPPPPARVSPAQAPPPAAAEAPTLSEFEIPVEESSEPTIELIEPTPGVAEQPAPPAPPPPAPVEKAAPPEPVAEIDLAEE